MRDFSLDHKAHRVFNRSTLTIEECIYVKFEESNTLVNNIVEINSLSEDIENISLKDSSAQEDEKKLKDNTNSVVQDDEVELTQSLSRN